MEVTHHPQIRAAYRILRTSSCPMSLRHCFLKLHHYQKRHYWAYQTVRYQQLDTEGCLKKHPSHTKLSNQKKTKLELQSFRAAVGAGLHWLRRSGCGFDDGAAWESRRGARSEERLGRRVGKAALDSSSQDDVVAPCPRAVYALVRWDRRYVTVTWD